jgi:allantoin racemase
MSNRCVSVRNITTDEEVAGIEGAGKAISELKEQSRSIQDRILEAIDLSVNKDSADTILLGCTCMAPVAPDIARQASVPVLDPMRTAYKTTESMLALGIRHSRKVYPKAQESSIKAVSALIEGGGNLDLGDGCEICVLE